MQSSGKAVQDIQHKDLRLVLHNEQSLTLKKKYLPTHRDFKQLVACKHGILVRLRSFRPSSPSLNIDHRACLVWPGEWIVYSLLFSLSGA